MLDFDWMVDTVIVMLLNFIIVLEEQQLNDLLICLVLLKTFKRFCMFRSTTDFYTVLGSFGVCTQH